jgi:hypothetical protein
MVSKKKLIAFLFLFIVLSAVCMPTVASVAYAAAENTEGTGAGEVNLPAPQEDQESTEKEEKSMLESAHAAIDREEGSMFEKIIANIVVSVGVALHEFGNAFLDFKSLDALVFNKGVEDPEVIMNKEWDSTMDIWFDRMQALAVPILFIAVIVTGFRFFKAATNMRAREETIAAVQRLALSGILLLFAPIFVDTLIKVNNALVEGIASLIDGSLDQSLGLSTSLIESIKTGSPLLTSVVIVLFAFLEFRLNIMFFMRIFTITILYVFTPFVTALWTIEKSVNAAGVWLGEIISNIFMQFAYAFVFMIFLAFTPYMGTGGTLICAMVIIPMAEMIRNSVQNLWTRLSGFDETGASMKAAGVLGTVAALPTLGKTVAAQFGGLGSVGKALGGMFGGAKGGGDTSGSTSGASAAGAAAGMAAGAAGMGAAGMTASAAGMGSAEAAGTTASAAGSAPGTHAPAMGGSVSNARANLITGLGIMQGVSNIAQTTAQTVTSIAALPAGEGGQRLAAGVGSLTGAAVRAVGTPVAMAGAALRTSFQNGEGVKGFGKAWKEMTGVQEGGFKNNMKTVGRSAQIMGTSVVSGLNGATDAIYMQRQMDSLDRMRP